MNQPGPFLNHARALSALMVFVFNAPAISLGSGTTPNKIVVACMGQTGATQTRITLYEADKKGQRRTVTITHGDFRRAGIPVLKVPGLAKSGLEVYASDVPGGVTILNFTYGKRSTQMGSLSYDEEIVFSEARLICRTP